MRSAPAVRPLVPGDIPRAVAIHLDVLHMEFLSRYGDAFLQRYYLAWLEADQGIALAAVDGDGALVGTLLGTLDTGRHSRDMVRRHGSALAWRLTCQAARHPTLARDLIATRGVRYLRGVGRMAAGRMRRPRRSGHPVPSPADDGRPPVPGVGEITHVLVDPDRQGEGIGRALMAGAVDVARAAGLGSLELVTPPDLAARRFYEHLGWSPAGAVTSRSGESFVRFRLALDPPGPP